ncbi:MAG: hypothetical protein RR746_08555 [Lachnospiraceae bacterium]
MTVFIRGFFYFTRWDEVENYFIWGAFGIGMIMFGRLSYKYIPVYHCIPGLSKVISSRAIRRIFSSEEFQDCEDLKGTRLYKRVLVNEHWIWINGYYLARNSIAMIAVDSERSFRLHMRIFYLEILFITGESIFLNIGTGENEKVLKEIIVQYTDGIGVEKSQFGKRELPGCVEITKRYMAFYSEHSDMVDILIKNKKLQMDIVTDLKEHIILKSGGYKLWEVFRK